MLMYLKKNSILYYCWVLHSPEMWAPRENTFWMMAPDVFGIIMTAFFFP